MPVDPAPKKDDLVERLPSQMQIAQVISEHLTAKAERNAKTGPIDVTIDVGEAAKAVLAIFTTTVAPLRAEVERLKLELSEVKLSPSERQWAKRMAEHIDMRHTEAKRAQAAEAALSRARAEAFEDLDRKLRALLRGEHSSLTLSFNDEGGPNYASAREVIEEWPDGQEDWVSDEERIRAAETNSIWSLQWYPETPVGFHLIKAASLAALLREVLSTKGDQARPDAQTPAEGGTRDA